MFRDPREQEQSRLPRRAPVLPLPLLAARIRRDPPEAHHHAEQDQVAESHIRARLFTSFSSDVGHLSACIGTYYTAQT